MVQEKTSTQKEIVCLIQVKPANIKYLLSESVKEGNIQLKSIDSTQELNAKQAEERTIAFIIGSTVEDPVQSAQRLHAYDKNATVVILGKPGDLTSLKKAIKFSPFIGVDVHCLDETDEAKLEQKLNKILINSLQAAQYRDIISQTNKKVSFDLSFTKSAVSQRFINKLMDIAPIGIAIVDKEGKLMGWNKKAATIFGESESQVLGMKLYQFFSEKESAKLKTLLGENFTARKKGLNDFLELEREFNDNRQFLSFTVAPFIFSERSENAFILVINETTERKQAKLDLQNINETLEQRVEERTRSLLSYQKQLRSLASQLSHAEEKVRQELAAEIHDNLGQMLAVNKMKLEALQNASLPDSIADKIEETKQGIDDAMNYARNLMSDLKPPPSLDKQDVTATIKWVTQKMKKHDLEVIFEDDGRPKRAREEIRTTLLQCVREVLFNIVRHAKVKKAHVKMTRTDHRIKIVVEDEGKGFDPRKNVYDPFEGSGFGLFNIHEQLDLLGGSVEIESEPEEGTRVTFIAPLKKDEKKADPSGTIQDTVEVSRGEKISVLLVDDHEMVRKGLKKIVNAEADLRVIGEASNGDEAIALAKEISPDVIVMDVNMPGTGGIEATKAITSAIPNVRIIGLSLHENDEVIENMRSAGASAYLSKNEAFKTLAATIRCEAKR